LQHESRGAAVGEHELSELEREQRQTTEHNGERERPYTNDMGEDSHEHRENYRGPGQDAARSRRAGLEVQLEVTLLDVDTDAREQWQPHAEMIAVRHHAHADALQLMLKLR